jgi:hypothetical protein
MDVSKRTVVVFIVLLLIVHVFAVFFEWYSNSLFDFLMHFLGGVWSAFFFWLLFKHFISSHLHHHFSEKIKMLIIIISFASLLGIGWELHAFILSEYFPSYLQEDMWQVMNGLIITIIGGGFGGWLMIYKSPDQKNNIV